MTDETMTDPTMKHFEGPFPAQSQVQPGRTALVTPVPDPGEES